MSKKKNIVCRVWLIYSLVCLFGLFIILRVIQIQYVETIEGKTWKDYAKDRISAERPMPANRGNIYTEDGHLLATSYPVFRLNWDAASPSDHDFYRNLDPTNTFNPGVGKTSKKAFYRT